MICPSCGSASEQGSYCSSCGARLGGTDAGATPTDGSGEAPAPASRPHSSLDVTPASPGRNWRNPALVGVLLLVVASVASVGVLVLFREKDKPEPPRRSSAAVVAQPTTDPCVATVSDWLFRELDAFLQDPGAIGEYTLGDAVIQAAETELGFSSREFKTLSQTSGTFITFVGQRIDASIYPEYYGIDSIDEVPDRILTAGLAEVLPDISRGCGLGSGGVGAAPPPADEPEAVQESPLPASNAVTASQVPTPVEDLVLSALREGLPGSESYRLSEKTGVFDPALTLEVVIGEAAAGASGYFDRAFFIVDGQLVGDDGDAPGVLEGGVSQTGDTTTLTYVTFEPGDPNCCPTGQTSVRYRWDGEELVRLDPVPQ